MKDPSFDTDPDRLGALLRASRATPPLPPRFQENVWRRIEYAATHATPLERDSWFDALATWILRPRLAFVAVAVLVLTGVGLGWSKGEQLARQDAQARYLAAVAPNPLR